MFLCLKNNLIFLLVIFPIFLLTGCNLPPALYTINTPLLFSCSTNYDPELGTEAEQLATWTNKCLNTEDTWIRFSVYQNQKSINGFVIYKTTPGTTYPQFEEMVSQHIVNKNIIESEHIIPFIANDTCTSMENGIDRGQTYPSLYLSNITKFSTPGYTIEGISWISTRQTSVIIPPLTCLRNGSFVITMVDYLNKAESSPSNILELE